MMTKRSIEYARYNEDDINAPEMTLDDIAEALGISKSRCDTIYRSAMKKVRLRLINRDIYTDMRDVIREILNK